MTTKPSSIAARCASLEAALTAIAQTIIRSWPPPAGDTFGPRVKLEDALNLRQIARDALKDS